MLLRPSARRTVVRTLLWAGCSAAALQAFSAAAVVVLPAVALQAEVRAAEVLWEVVG